MRNVYWGPSNLLSSIKCITRLRPYGESVPSIKSTKPGEVLKLTIGYKPDTVTFPLY